MKPVPQIYKKYYSLVSGSLNFKENYTTDLQAAIQLAEETDTSTVDQREKKESEERDNNERKRGRGGRERVGRDREEEISFSSYVAIGDILISIFLFSGFST